jgi:hypothetical protein
MRFPLRCRSYLRDNLEDNPGHFPDANVQEQFLAIIADKTNLPVNKPSRRRRKLKESR